MAAEPKAEKKSLFRDKKDAAPAKNVEHPKEGGKDHTPEPAAHGHVALIAKHHAERHAMHQGHRSERRDMHGRHRSEHDDMHNRHQTAHEDMAARHGAEMAQAAALPPAMPAPGPALGAQPAPAGTPTSVA